MVRLFIPPARLAGTSVALDADELGYLVRVRRLAPGDSVEVFDGEGGRIAARLAAGNALALGARDALAVSRLPRLELWQALTKGDKLELVVQKATELGVSRIVPFASERSIVKLAGERADSRVARLRKIAVEAARQCERSDVPEVTAPRTLADFCAPRPDGAIRALLYEREGERRLWDFLKQSAAAPTIALAIGPEGGFSTAEVAQVEAAAIPLVGLGQRILRAETAAIAASALFAFAVE